MISDLPSRLIRFDVDSIESMMRPFRFSFARRELVVAGRRPATMSSICCETMREALGEVLLPRADVDADLAGVGVLGGEGVDGVREAALLPDLLEEARRGGAAEDAVQKGRG